MSFSRALLPFTLLLASCSSEVKSTPTCTSDPDCMSTESSSAASSSSGATGGGGSGGNAASSSSGSGGSSTSSSTSSSSSSGTLPLPPSCHATCTTPQDCVSSGAISLHDADNWNCNAGACEYKGCNSNQECIDAYMDSTYVCAVVSSLTIPSCTKKCTTNLNCATALPLYDNDNWACTGGACDYKGCNTNVECMDSLMGANYACEFTPGLSIKSCRPTCTMISDCVNGSTVPTLDADNWDCVLELCEYKGCNSSQECIDANMNAPFVCQ